MYVITRVNISYVRESEGINPLKTGLSNGIFTGGIASHRSQTVSNSRRTGTSKIVNFGCACSSKHEDRRVQDARFLTA